MLTSVYRFILFILITLLSNQAFSCELLQGFEGSCKEPGEKLKRLEAIYSLQGPPPPIHLNFESVKKTVTRHHVKKAPSVILFMKDHHDKESLEENKWCVYTSEEQSFEELPEPIRLKAKKWESPPGNIYANFGLYIPFNSIETFNDFSAVGQLTVIQLFEKYGVKATFKHPNDVLVNNKKVCGIGGSGLEQHGSHHFIIGLYFGININMSEEECARVTQPATSLAIETGKQFDVEALTEEFIEQYVYNMATLTQQKWRDVYFPQLDARTAYRGWTATYTSKWKEEPFTLTGVYLGKDFKNNILFSVNGEIKKLAYGDVTYHTPPILSFPVEEPKPTILVTPVQEDVTLKREGVTAHESPKRQRVEAFPEEPQKPKILVTPPIKNVMPHVLTKEQFDFHLLRKNENGELDDSYTSIYWGKSKVFEGTKVYQHRSIIDPDQESVDKRDKDKVWTNLELMKMGKAPIGPDGKPINLHHLLQTPDGPVAEVTHELHFGYYKILHVNVGSKYPSGIDRHKFKNWKKRYWKERAKDFEESEG